MSSTKPSTIPHFFLPPSQAKAMDLRQLRSKAQDLLAQVSGLTSKLIVASATLWPIIAFNVASAALVVVNLLFTSEMNTRKFFYRGLTR